MSRTLTAGVQAAIALGNVPLVMLVEMDFPSAFLRFNNSGQTLAWDGHDWLGFGNIGSIEPITEAADLSANGLAFVVSGVASEHIANALGQDYQGRSCKVWYAVLDSDYQVIADPIGPFSYRMDTMDIELGQTASIRVTAESRLTDWERAPVSRYTSEEQQRLYPGDLGLEFVPQMSEKQIRWGW